MVMDRRGRPGGVGVVGAEAPAAAGGGLPPGRTAPTQEHPAGTRVAQHGRPALAVERTPTTGGRATGLRRLVLHARRCVRPRGGVAAVAPPVPNESGDTAILAVIPTDGS